MEFTFENQGASTYLVYVLGPEEQLDSISLGMLTNNKIPGIAPAFFAQMNERRYIKYNVSAKVSAKQLLSGMVNPKRLVGVLNGIADGLLSAEDYMLDTNAILLDLDHIFADVTTGQASLICLPVRREGRERDLRSFFKNIMMNTEFDTAGNSDIIVRIFNFLNASAAFSLTEFKKVLNQGEPLPAAARPAERTAASSSARVPESAAPRTAAPAERPETAAGPAPAERPMDRQPVRQTAIRPQAAQVGAAAVGQVKPAPASRPQTAGYAQQPPRAAYTDPGRQAAYAVPGQRAAYAAPAQPRSGKPGGMGGERMSLLYLLQHYNKENAAVYKAQKEAEKKAKGAAPAAAAKREPGRAAARMVPPPQPPRQVPVPVRSDIPVPGQQPAQQIVSAYRAPTPQPAAAREPVRQPDPVRIPRQPSVPAESPRQTKPMPEMNFGETTVLSGGTFAPTTVLSASMIQKPVARPFLIRAKNQEKIYLDKPEFRIGKERNYVDYFVGDNTAVSRSHANILSRNGACFVVDTNSTNHTFINGEMIQSNVETELNHGDTLTLGNEVFTFYMH